MNGKEKTALDDCSIESGAGNRVSGLAVEPPACDCITNGYRPQEIAGLLFCGTENAIGTQTLMRLTGCSSARQLQERIAVEREGGAVTLSNEHGYFLPCEGEAGRRELHRFIQTMERRAAGTLRAAESAKAALGLLEEMSHHVKD